ncbi:MAG: c-type cytochrome [Myxococcaceae bacterium]
MNTALLVILLSSGALPDGAAEQKSAPVAVEVPMTPPPLRSAEVDLSTPELTDWDRERTTAFFVRVALGGELAPTGSTRSDDSAKEIWAGRCAHCHGAEGQPRKLAAKNGARDLSSVDWQTHRTDEQLRQVIENGAHDSRMKAFRVALTRDQVTDLVAYIRDFKRGPVPATLAVARN